MEKIRIEEDPTCVFASFQNSKVVGFALIQNKAHRAPIGGAVWRNSLGSEWGALGPIGVAAEYRGIGLGHGTLGKALEHLKGLGVRRCIIDWTTLKDFYGRHGFEVTRNYKSCNLRISE
jgi:predicted N-acetyltransferase YhbS